MPEKIILRAGAFGVLSLTLLGYSSYRYQTTPDVWASICISGGIIFALVALYTYWVYMDETNPYATDYYVRLPQEEQNRIYQRRTRQFAFARALCFVACWYAMTWNPSPHPLFAVVQYLFAMAAFFTTLAMLIVIW